MLASILALLSYVPFEWVAKFSLLVCALVFVFDPIPPVSRLLALIATAVVMMITKTLRQWQLENEDHGTIIEGQEGEEKVAAATTTAKKRKKSRKEE